MDAHGGPAMMWGRRRRADETLEESLHRIMQAPTVINLGAGPLLSPPAEGTSAEATTRSIQRMIRVARGGEDRVIPEAAVEAAAVMIAEARCADVDRDAGYGDGENLTPDDYAIFMPSARENARIYLEAAAPHMLPSPRRHECETWMIQQAPGGARYCASCGTDQP